MKNLILLALACLLLGCKTTKNTRPEKITVDPIPSEELAFYILEKEPDIYQRISLFENDKPVPKQGKQQWYKDYYMGMRYPAVARENNVQGIVIMEVIGDVTGRVESVTITRSLSPECDAEALRAYKSSISEGYEPFYYAEKISGFKMEIPVYFRLE